MTALTPAQATTVARSIAADNGLTLETDDLAAVVERLSADLALNDNHKLAFGIAAPFTIERGQVVDALPLEHALGVIREHAKPIEKPPTPEAAPPASTSNHSRYSENFGPKATAASDAALIAEAHTV